MWVDHFAVLISWIKSFISVHLIRAGIVKNDKVVSCYHVCDKTNIKMKTTIKLHRLLQGHVLE